MMVGYTALGVLIAVLLFSMFIVYRAEAFPNEVVISASATIFVEVLAFVFKICKSAFDRSHP